MTVTAPTEQLAAVLRGRLVTPQDADYDEARSIWNGMIDRRPAMIVQCSGTADVIHCVNFARENGIPVTVKAGGHSVPGKSMCNDGLVIDLSPMNGVTVDPELKTAQVQGGATLGDMDHETQAFGLATPAGVDSRTGVAGLTLGGGNGHLARRFGLSCDNLLAADVVTADGTLVRASDSENADLLWALKGGGGNFGVVTSFEFKLHAVGPEILTAQVFHLFDDAPNVLRHFRDFMSSAPREVGANCVIMRVPPMPPFPEEHHGKLAIAIVANYSAGDEHGQPVLKPLAEFGNPILSFVMPMPYTAFQAAFDAGNPNGARYYIKSQYLRELSDAAIDTLVDHVGSKPGEITAVMFETMGGAINEVDPAATAFPHRNAAFNFGILSGWLDPAVDEEIIAWARRFHQAMQPWSTGGVYVNYLQGDDGDEFQRAYGQNYERLKEIKTQYDPHGLFNAHQRIAVAM